MIDVSNFTPYSSFLGGLIIGLAVILFYFTTGRLAGISGIFFSSLDQNKDRLSNILFVIGLIFGPLFYLIIYENNINFQMTSSISLIFIGGLLVGIGTKIGTGCTSGHGICGISRFSIRSLLATIIFVIFGMLTVFILGFFGVY